MLDRLARQAGRSATSLLRLVACHEAEVNRGAIAETVSSLQDALENWAQVEGRR